MLLVGLILGGVLAFGLRWTPQRNLPAEAVETRIDGTTDPDRRDTVESTPVTPLSSLSSNATLELGRAARDVTAERTGTQEDGIKALRKERDALQEQREALERVLQSAHMDYYELSSDPDTSHGQFLRSEVAQGLPATQRYVLAELLKDLPVKLSAAEALMLAESEEQFAEAYYVAATLGRTEGLSVQPRYLAPIDHDDRQSWVRRKEEAAKSPPEPVDVETAVLARLANLIATLGADRLAKEVDPELLRKFFGPHYESTFGG